MGEQLHTYELVAIVSGMKNVISRVQHLREDMENYGLDAAIGLELLDAQNRLAAVKSWLDDLPIAVKERES